MSARNRSGGHAKVLPRFGERSAAPGERKVAELGARPVPRAFEFKVPRLPPGLYVGELWFRGMQTDDPRSAPQVAE